MGEWPFPPTLACDHWHTALCQSESARGRGLNFRWLWALAIAPQPRVQLRAHTRAAEAAQAIGSIDAVRYVSLCAAAIEEYQ
jgi:hypothetical protein